jgi:hypothetical protein
VHELVVRVVLPRVSVDRCVRVRASGWVGRGQHAYSMLWYMHVFSTQ